MRTPTTLLLAAALLTSCGSVGRYAADRALDLTDIVDVRVGLAWGLGAKVEATRWVGLGAGFAVQPWTREWFGRRSVVRDQHFLHIGVMGWETRGIHGSDHDMLYLLGVNGLQVFDDFDENGVPLEWPGVIERFRFGGRVLLGVDLGLYVNLGEIADLLVGLAGFDPAGDDGVSKLAVGWPEPRAEASGEDAASARESSS